MIMYDRIFVSGLLAVALTVSVGPRAYAQADIVKKTIAKAEAAVAKVQKACATDVTTFCSKVTPGDGRLALCMMAHEDKIGDGCFDALLGVADGISLAISNLERAADACVSDIQKHCASVEPGAGRLAQCLISKKAQLSTPCRSEVAGFEARMQK
jgi:hypothetical protein